MRVGLQIWSFNWPGSPENIGSKLGDLASAADAAGFYSLWVMDHFFQMDRAADAHEPGGGGRVHPEPEVNRVETKAPSPKRRGLFFVGTELFARWCR